MKGYGVLNKFDDADCGGKGYDFVGSDSKIALPGSSLRGQKIVDLLKDLFHDGVLPQVIVTSFDLFRLADY